MFNIEGWHNHIITEEQTKIKLESLEKEIANQYSISGSNEEIHLEIIKQYKSGSIIEDELVLNWLDIWSSYLSDLKYHGEIK